MLPSETPTFDVRGVSDLADPLAAFRCAVADAARAMAAIGATPGDVVAMTWTARIPACIHPIRTEVDLALREVFAGVRAPISLRAADHDGVAVGVQLRAPKPLSSDPVYRGLALSELARAYSPRATVSNIGAIFETWRTDGAAFRARHLTVELQYGPTHGETLDLYVPPNTRGPLPLWIFIHGGYWQAIDKAHNAQFAAGMLAHGYAVAMLNYTLAPPASLAEIVRQIQAAVVFLAREATALGCDPNAMHIAGHSAGGHLAAMIACLPEGQLIRSSLALSGLFDLEPLALLPMGRLVQFNTADAIARLSPQRFQPLPNVTIGVAVGGDESLEFQRQSTTFATAWNSAPCRIIADQNHFSLLDGLNGGALLDFALEIARA